MGLGALTARQGPVARWLMGFLVVVRPLGLCGSSTMLIVATERLRGLAAASVFSGVASRGHTLACG